MDALMKAAEERKRRAARAAVVRVRRAISESACLSDEEFDRLWTAELEPLLTEAAPDLSDADLELVVASLEGLDLSDDASPNHRETGPSHCPAPGR